MSFRVNNRQTARPVANNGRFAIPGRHPQPSIRRKPALPRRPPLPPPSVAGAESRSIVRTTLSHVAQSVPTGATIPSQPLNLQLLDTHHYDGQLDKSLIQTIQTLQENIDASLTVEKTGIFTRLVEDLKRNPKILDKYRSAAIGAVNLISCDIRKPPNFDNKDKLFADDVLYIVCKQIDESKNVDVLVFLAEQLSDIITSGQCEQGRCTRIFQVLLSLENYAHEKQSQIPNES